MSKIVKKSSFPLLYGIKVKEIKYLDELRVKLSDRETIKNKNFNFVGSLNSNEKRKILSIDNLFKKDEDVSKLYYFITRNLNIFLHVYFKENKIKFLDRGRVLARIRLFEDHPGYFLAPHNDSSDTIASLIIPIYPGQQKTAAFELIKTGNILNTDQDINFYIEKLYDLVGISGYKIYGNDFEGVDDVNIAVSDNKEMVLVISKNNINNNYKFNIHADRNFSLSENEIISICNPNCAYIEYGDELYGNITGRLSKHGVMPTLKIRRNLIIDLLASEGGEVEQDKFGLLNSTDIVIEYGAITKNYFFFT